MSVRALLLNDDDELIVFRRDVPGRGVYYTAPGGKIDPGEDDETALRRELFEELGATTGELRYLFSTPATAEFQTAHRFYVTRLVSMNLTLRTGEEFHNPAKGTYDVEQIHCDVKTLRAFHWVPAEMSLYLNDHGDSLPSLAPRR